jgi:hypothetical protein
MAKSDYIDTGDDKFATQLQAFKTNIGGYATTLGLMLAQLTAQAADSDYFTYILACQEIMVNGGKQATTWKDIIRDGGTPPPSGAPVAPTFPTAVAAVEPGIEPRFRALVKQIKAHASYNEAIGKALGIEGADHVAPDLATLQPEIEARLNGGTVDVRWGWNGYSTHLDMIELQVDRGEGKGFVMLAYDTTPGYTDTAALPGAPAKWTYRGIYRVGDKQIGQWSKPASVVVGG